MPRTWMHGRYSDGWVYTQTLTRLHDVDPVTWSVLEAILDSEEVPESGEALTAFVRDPVTHECGARPLDSSCRR